MKREHPGQREEVVLFWEVISKVHQSHPKQVFSGDDVDAWVVVDLLEEMHFDEHIGIDGEVSPIDIPIACIVTILYFPVEFLSYFNHHRILSH